MESLPKKRKLLLIAMRITCLQLLISVVLSGLAVANEGLAQESLARNVSVQIENKPLKTALGILEKSANVKFTYLPQLVSKNDKVSISANMQPLSVILEKLLKPLNLAYEASGEYIILTKAETQLLEKKGFTPIKAIDQNVKGRVNDEKGEGLPGVSVLIKGSQRGATTDANGEFSLTVPDEKAILIFSYVGYLPQEIVVGNQTSITVSLKADLKTLNEVVVVGYGVQKKANLTGAVDMITSEVFENRPMTNLNQGLQGVLPNLNIKMGDGKPNQAPSFNIRGTTSIGQGGSALVLIDNVEGDPSLLNPNDIASITLLKDAASASIYGARGVFGVVLITTKNPTAGKTNVTYSSNYSIKQPIARPDLVTDGYTWASMFAESFVNFGGTFPQNANKTLKFSQAYLNELKRRSEVGGLPEVEIDPATGEYV